LLFGNTSSFAIESEIENVSGVSAWGKFFLWLGGVRLGNPEEILSLRECCADLCAYLNGCEGCKNSDLADLNGHELLVRLANTLVESIDSIPPSWDATFDSYRKYMLSLDFSYSLDRHFVVVIARGNEIRFVWAEFDWLNESSLPDPDDVREIQVSRSDVSAAIREFCRWTTRGK